MNEDRYQIREEIGRGGLGVVYRALDAQLGREVAIKKVRVDSEEEVKTLTRNLVEEARILSALNHPNIVTVHDVGADAEGPYIVMELLEGDTLDEVIERGALTVSDFEEFALQCLDGMVAAQSVDLLHRDLKPPNIMLVWLPSGKFQVKILDFGLAKFARTPSTQTMDHNESIMGSIYFMAPEQFERLPLDARTDLYSLGCLFYYALAGSYPFVGEQAVHVMAAHMQHHFTPLQEVRPDVPSSIGEWIENLFAREMDDRPSDAREALETWSPHPVIDEKQLREAASDDPELAAELFDGFRRETAELLEQLNAELAAGDGTAARETAQTIRGSGSTLGYSGIVDLARDVEEYAGSDAEYCRTLLRRFDPVINQLGRAVGRLSWPGKEATS